MNVVLEYGLSIAVAALVVVTGTYIVGEMVNDKVRSKDHYGENVTRVHMIAVRAFSWMCVGIAGIYKSPNIIEALANLLKPFP